MASDYQDHSGEFTGTYLDTVRFFCCTHENSEWDASGELTGNSLSDLNEAIQILSAIVSDLKRIRREVKPPSLSKKEPWATRKLRESREMAAKLAGTSGQSVSRCNFVLKHAPDLGVRMQSGTISINKAYQIAKERKAVAEAVSSNTTKEI